MLDLLNEANNIIRHLVWDLRNPKYDPIKDIEIAENFVLEHNYDKIEETDIMNLKSKVNALEDRISRLSFFYEGNGFTKRGLTTSIQIANYIEQLENKIKELQYNNKKEI